MKKWVVTILAMLVLITAAVTVHRWVPLATARIGELIKDDKVSHLNDLAELIFKIFAWPAAVVTFFIRLWRDKKASGDQQVVQSDNVTGDKVGGDKVAGDKNTVSGGDVVKGDKIVYQAPATPPPPALPTLFQLPPPPADFTGREAELRELLQAIEHGGVRISGLQGAGGVGKTALALKLAAELAPRFPDAQIFLDLKGASEKPLTAAGALGHVLRSFHPEAKLPEGENELRSLFTSELHGKRVLLLMDNARDAAQVQPLIPPAGSTLLVTSRPAFTLPGLKQKKLDTFPPDDAKKFLLTIAPRIGSAADSIAKACGYLALALRLAATAIAERADLDPGEYGRKLADESKRLSLLPQAAGEPSMEASIGLSYNLLSPDMQTRWRMLGVFPDTFDAPAAAAVWETDKDAAQATLSDLVRFSMLDWDEASRRYHLHDLMRDYARGKMAEAERDATAFLHAHHYVAVLGAADELYRRGGESIMAGLAVFDLESRNIQRGQVWAAAHIGSNPRAAQLCTDYPDRGANVIELRQRPRESIRWREAALAGARKQGERAAEARHLGSLGYAHDDLGDYRHAIAYYEQALAIFREIGDRRGEGAALANLGGAHYSLGEYRRAIEFYGQALLIMCEIGDLRGEAAALGNLGSAYHSLGEYPRAIEFLERHLKIARDTGDWRGEGKALGNLGAAYHSLGEHRRAIEFHEQHLKIAREIGDRQDEGKALGKLGSAYRSLGECLRAIEYHGKALAIDREIGDRRGEGENLGEMGSDYEALGECRSAIEFHRQHLAIAREIGDRLGQGAANWNMSVALVKLGKRKQAVEPAEAALSIFEQIESPHAAMVRSWLQAWRRES